MKELSIRKLLQDISAIVGSLLPIAQLFFSQWIYAFDKIFQAKEQFLGISIVTLIVSYIFIIAFLSDPYGEIVIPGQGRKQKRLQDYWNKRNLLESQIKTLTELPDINVPKILGIFKKIEDLVQPANPMKINQQNQVKVIVGLIVVSALVFVALGFVDKAGTVVLVVQTIAYIILIAFSALMLMVYKRNSDNGNSWKDNNRTRTDRAIKLAIDANGFGSLPQVTFMSQQEVGGFVGNLHVQASYKGEVYNIVTDREAQYLVSVYKDKEVQTQD